jgi:transcriptional regulator with XRE-family HTH domain
MQTLQERLEELMTAKGWQRDDLIRISGQSQSVVSQWLGKSSKIIKTIGKMEAAQALAIESGYESLWIAKGIGPKKSPQGSPQPLHAGAAHPVSQLVTETVPSITWEQIKMSVRKNGLPPVFRVQMVDNAMAPRAGSGAWVQFSSTEAARPGDGVLVRDALGNQYFRQYRAGRPGCWEAHADNAAFAALDSERDGLEVLAVLMAVEARWG